MLFSILLQRLHDRGSLAYPVRLASGHIHVHLLTDIKQSVESLPRTLANSLNLMQDGAPLKDAIAQLDMHIKPSEAQIATLLDIAPNCSLVLCKLSKTFAVVQHGMFVFYVDEFGATYSCWSQANDRNRNQ